MIDRYTLPEMAEVWSEDAKLRHWLRIEILACEAWGELGRIPPDELEAIRTRASVDADRVRQIEDVTRHDVAAFVQAMAETVGPEGRWIHFGMTSSDLLDTGLALQLREASDLLLTKLEELLAVVKAMALEHRDIVCVGRTHGVHAEPTTFGHKLAVYAFELARDRDRLRRAREAVSVGKVSGVVGTYAAVDPFVEEHVCRELGLQPADAATQVVQRDVHADYLSALAVTGATLEKIAVEIRHLARTEVREVQEPFEQGQKGSSAMPHKRNPILCERITGLARLLRTNHQASLENVALWHERDISHSSVERVILPDSTILLALPPRHRPVRGGGPGRVPRPDAAEPGGRRRVGLLAAGAAGADRSRDEPRGGLPVRAGSGRRGVGSGKGLPSGADGPRAREEAAVR